MGKPTICICENKGADQLRGNREADQRHCFRYADSTIPLLLKSEISSFWLFSVLIQVGLCRTCSETTLLVFSRGGSLIVRLQYFVFQETKRRIPLLGNSTYGHRLKKTLETFSRTHVQIEHVQTGFYYARGTGLPATNTR